MEEQGRFVNIYIHEKSIEYKRFESVIKAIKEFNGYMLKLKSQTIQVAKLDMMTTITICVAQFAKSIPEFKADFPDDQIAFLKNGGRDMTILWMARRYNIKAYSIVAFYNQSWSCEYFDKAHFGDIVDDFLELSQLVHRIRVDDMECAFLGILSLSAEHGLMEIVGHNLKNAREIYMRLFRDYIKINHGQKGSERFAKLLTILPKLRLLCNGFDKGFSNLRNEGYLFPAPIVELWNLH